MAGAPRVVSVAARAWSIEAVSAARMVAVPLSRPTGTPKPRPSAVTLSFSEANSCDTMEDSSSVVDTVLIVPAAMSLAVKVSSVSWTLPSVTCERPVTLASPARLTSVAGPGETGVDSVVKSAFETAPIQPSAMPGVTPICTCPWPGLTAGHAKAATRPVAEAASR